MAILAGIATCVLLYWFYISVEQAKQENQVFNERLNKLTYLETMALAIQRESNSLQQKYYAEFRAIDVEMAQMLALPETEEVLGRRRELTERRLDAGDEYIKRLEALTQKAKTIH